MSDPIPFLSPRLVGERFQGGAIPLEVLKDLAALEEMIVEAARWTYLAEHLERKKAPRGFASGVSLRMVGVAAGSAVPIIALFATDASLRQNRVDFERARDRIIAAIDAAAHNEPVTEHLPESLLGYFDRVGRSLRRDESIEFNPADPARPARLTRSTRRRLVLSSTHVQAVGEEVALRGSVPEVDQDAMSFMLQVISGPKIRASMGSQHLPTVMDAFNGYRSGTRILLQGIGRYNRSNRLQGIDMVEYVSLLDPNDVGARLDEFRGLEPGWLEGKGVPPSPQGLDWLNQGFDAHYPEHLPLPYLYPTAEGGVRAEWSLSGYELSLDVALEIRRAEWHALHLATDDEEARELDLEQRDDWAWLTARIAEITRDEVP